MKCCSSSQGQEKLNLRIISQVKIEDDFYKIIKTNTEDDLASSNEGSSAAKCRDFLCWRYSVG